MRYTTVIWEPPATPEQGAQCDTKIKEMEARGIHSDLTLVNEGTRDVAIRSWPELANAEEWCDFVLNIGCASASVDPVQ
jgi:hypothetical protein